MGKKITRVAKSVLALVLAVCMMFDSSVAVLAAGNDSVVATSETATTVEAAADGITDINGDGKINYVTFGDSVTNGYGMTGYRFDDGTNVLGFRREVAGSYPVEIANYLETKTGLPVNLQQMALSGFRMDELHWMLCDDYEGDYYHYDYFAKWNRRIFERTKNSTDPDAQKEYAYYVKKYGQAMCDEACTDARDEKRNTAADRIIMKEYREAVKNADFVTIDLGTNNFGTFLTSTIASILVTGNIDTTLVNNKTDFSHYLDAKSAATLSGIVDQMATSMADGETSGMKYDLIRTLARCMMFGYLGFTENYDGALDALYEINPDAQVIVIDMYTMISGVQLTGEALGDVDLDEMYNMFVDMANFYANELSPYAQKVTHADLDKGDPKLLIDDYAGYVYPDNQGALVKMYQKDENGEFLLDEEGNKIPNKDYNETAVTLLNEFIMEGKDMDPDEPEEREKFYADVVSNIELLDEYVYDLQATIQKMIIDEQIISQLEDQLAPVELAMDAIDLIYAAVNGVELAESGVDTAISKYPLAEDAVKEIKDGVVQAEGALTTIKEGVVQAEDALNTAKDGVKTAEEAVDTAVDGVGLAQQIVNLLLENLINHETYGGMFSGSSTSSMIKSIIISNIEGYITDDIMNQAGFEPTSANKEMLAEEAYKMACVYKDATKDGKTAEEANKLAVLEGLSFMLQKTQGLSAADASETAELAWNINTIYKNNGEKAAVIAAMETKISQEIVDLLGASTKAEAAAFAYEVSKKSKDDAIVAIMETQITDAMVTLLGASTKAEAAAFAYEVSKKSKDDAIVAIMETQISQEILDALKMTSKKDAAVFAYELSKKSDKDAIVAVIETQITTEILEALGTADKTYAANYVYNLYANYKENGGADNHDEARKAAVIWVVEQNLPVDMVASVGLSTAEAAVLAYDVAMAYNTLKDNGADEATAISTCLINVAGKMDMTIDEKTAATGYQLYAGVYKPAIDGGVEKKIAKSKAVEAALTATFKEAGMDETTAAKLAAAVNAVYNEQAKDSEVAATREQESLAIITLLTQAFMKQNMDETTAKTLAAAIYECYCPASGNSLDGHYKDSNVETTMKFFITQALKVDMTKAGELYASYLSYKNVAETLGKISRLHDIYFDSLLGAASGGGISVGDIATKIQKGTLVLEAPDESDPDYAAKFAQFQMDSSLAIFYFRFMAADGVFTHPSIAGHTTFVTEIKEAMAKMVPDAEADSDVVVTDDTSILSIGDAVVDATNENNYTEAIATRLGVSNVNYVTNKLARLEDFHHALTGKTGDAFAEEVVGEIDNSLAEQIKENDIILVNLGSMNLGYSAMQLAKYMSSANGETYAMTFGDKECMKVRGLGERVDTFLGTFQQLIGVKDQNGDNTDNSPTSVGSIMLLLESYGYGITTFANDFNNFMDAIHALNEDATIVLVGVGNMLGDGYFQDPKSGAYFELGHFYQHGANILNGHMEKYADQTANVFYMDTLDAANGNNTRAAFNIAAEMQDATIINNAHFTDAGHMTVAGKFNCDNFDVHFTKENKGSYKEANCTEDGQIVIDCVLCDDVDGQITVLKKKGHAYADSLEASAWAWTDSNNDGYPDKVTVTVPCTACDHKAVVSTDKVEVKVPNTATCTEAGYIEYQAKVTVEDTVNEDAAKAVTYTGTTQVATEKAGHVYGANPSWTWADDKKSATATFACTRKDAANNSVCNHTKTVEASVEIDETNAEKTCTKAGEIVYTARVTFEGETFSDVATVTVPAGHEYKDGYCTVCGTYDPDVRPNPSGECGEKKAASLTSGASLILSLGGTAVGTYTFTETADGWTIKGSDGKYVALVNEALGYSDTAFAWKYADGKFSADVTKETTSSSGSSSNNWFNNIFGGSGLGGIFGGIFGGGSTTTTTTTTYYLVAGTAGLTVSTSATGADATFATMTYTSSHKYDDGVVTAPTCTEKGYTTFTCTVCGNKVKMHETKALGHNYAENVVAPTCTADGYTEHKCACGDSYKDNTVKATGHNFGEDGVCTKCGAKNKVEVEVDKEVSLTAGTYELRLGGTSVGTYTFAQSGSNWTIKTADGKYVALSGGALTYSDSAFEWTYSNGRFSATESSSSSSSSGSSWLDSLFGGSGLGGIFGGSSSNKTTTYYLVASNGALAVSTSTSNAIATFFTKETQLVDPEEKPEDTPATPDPEPEQPEPEQPEEDDDNSSSSSGSSWFESLFGGSFGNIFGSLFG